MVKKIKRYEIDRGQLVTEVSYIEEGDYITGCLYSTYRSDGTLYSCSYESLDAIGDALDDVKALDGRDAG